MSIAITLADANILVSRTLRDYFVYAAKLGALEIRWSELILDETARNLITQFSFSPQDAELLVERLTAYLPTALVEVKKRDQARVAEVDMGAKDRHVLAAALSAGADLLLTENTSDFPQEWMAAHGIELIDAGTLLRRLTEDSPDALREAHRRGVASRPQTEEQVLEILARIVGQEASARVRMIVQLR